MSLYDDSSTMDLYADVALPDTPLPELEPEPVDSPDPREAVSQSLQLIANPAKLVTDVLLPADPSQSKLPLGLAVLGACIAAIVLAGSYDKGGKR